MHYKPIFFTTFTIVKLRYMKVLLDIKDNKAPFVMEVLKNFPFVKTKQITAGKALLIEELKEAVEEINKIKAGKKKAHNAEDFINGL